jgi:cytochrome c peroxidase
MCKFGQILIVIGILFSCNRPVDKPFELSIPPGFTAPTIPKENELTQKKVALGQLLFFDPILSDDSTIACAHCHVPELGFTDGKKLPLGIHGNIGTRNSPSLVNVAYYPYFFAEGKVKDLETQALAPGLHAEEMGTEMKKMIYRLRASKFYRKKFKEVFNEEIDVKHFVYALAAYERTLIAANNTYNRFLVTRDSLVFTKNELAGMNLFFSSRTNCSKCHQGNLFTDFSFQNIGLYTWYADAGVARATSLAADSGKFKTPSLLNVAFTAPYMHDGSLATLEEVVDFYNTGGKLNKNKSEWVQPLGLSEEEKKCLVSFLKTLTDEDLKNKKGIFKTPLLF